MTGPAWLDPHWMSAMKLRQMRAHEDEIRRLERERARRRLEALLATTGTTWCREEADFDGCTL